ncbi:pentapeptide repeat-containing protein [Streptomyces sp. NBC_01410]|uniref:pentapeptide repeat-containing protein n=1 Tax=Streptomyces sp. NBC_01410 TaxID=2903856 RepID=UPI00324AFF3D
MPHPSPEPSLTPPDWPHCGHGTTPEDPVGCRGIHVPGHTACLAHLADADRDAYLAGLTPGTDIDHRGTLFSQPLLAALLGALRDPATGHPRFGVARFGSATFQGRAWFVSATFEGRAGFRRATFEGDAEFGSATFKSIAWFVSATFEGTAGFSPATFEGDARFESATFKGDAGFGSATFQGEARFDSATFKDIAGFNSVTFEGAGRFGSATFKSIAWFESATFRGTTRYGWRPIEGSAWFDSATFEGDARFESASIEGSARFESATFQGIAGFESATIEGAAWFESATFQGIAGFESATFKGAAWFDSATFQSDAGFESATHLRYATVDFAHAVFEYPLTIAAETDPFVLPDGRPVAEQALAGAPDATVRMASLRGVDAAHLVLADVDLSGCLFTGTVHLDQLRLEGTCSFDKVPPRTHWRRWRPIRFTQRRTLAEEHHWRASQPTAVGGWNVAVFGAGHVGPAQLAPVYRALRKAFEDGKNEPGAADFYYGEMEMRRHDRTGTTSAERGLLHGYWVLSGYGLRASRALGWLAAAMLVTIVLLMGFGLPRDSPKQQATGTVPPGGGKVTFEIDKADPQNPTGERFTGERFEKALNVTLNSVVFRSSGQDLTTVGTYIEMTSRVTEPVLLGLAVLAVRNRVKR